MAHKRPSIGALTVNRPPEELDQYRVLIRQKAPLRGFLHEAEQHPDEDLTGLVPDLDAANEMLEARTRNKGIPPPLPPPPLWRERGTRVGASWPMTMSLAKGILTALPETLH